MWVKGSRILFGFREKKEGRNIERVDETKGLSEDGRRGRVVRKVGDFVQKEDNLPDEGQTSYVAVVNL